MIKKTYKAGLADFGLNKRSRAIFHLKLTDDNVFTVCADVRGVGYGQVIDECEKAYSNSEDKLAKAICDMWRKYHLNDMHAGTKRQEDLLKYCKSHDYKEQCDFLEKHSMLFDNGYKYGTAWLKEEIPTEDLEEIKVILKIL